MSNKIIVLGKEKTTKVRMHDKHIGTNLLFEKKKSVSGGDRVYLGVRIQGLSGLKEIQPVTSIGVNKNELDSFIKFLKRVTIKLETMSNEG